MYFLTIRAHDRRPIFGDIRDAAMTLNECGRMVRDIWMSLPARFPHVRVGDFIVMPDHFHAILTIVGAGFPRPLEIDPVGIRPVLSGPRSGSLGQIVAFFKYTSTVRINAQRRSPGIPVWQRDYWDRVIRDHDELERVRAYIAANPRRWRDTGRDEGRGDPAPTMEEVQCGGPG